MSRCEICKYNNEDCKGIMCIKNIPLLSNLNDDEIEKISEGVVVKPYKKGEIIFRTGDKADKLYIICSGKMKIYKDLTDGREQILYIYSAGDFIGGFNLLKKDEYKFNGVALEDTIVSTLSKAQFDEIVLKNPTIPLKILEKAYDRIIWAEDLVERLSSNNIDSRVASLLLKLIQDFGSDTKEGMMLNLSINREEMGSFAGVSRETMTRKLNRFKEMGYIDFIGNKKILIKDVEVLKDML